MTAEATESLEAFRARAEAWITENLPPISAPPVDGRSLQQLLFDHGFAGIAFPTEYGGAGLSLEHQKVFVDTADELDRQIPATTTSLVSIGMLAPTILENGSEAAKRRFLPSLLRGDDVWIQLLSEPRGGSDLAGAITRLTADGDSYVLNGAKMWSSDAHLATYGLCLCRSDWDAPKHRGLSMVAVPLQGTPGVTINQIRGASGELKEYCEEFFDDVVLPRENLIGEEHQGWAVAQNLLFHERNATANIGYGYMRKRRRPAKQHPFMPRNTMDLVAAACARDAWDAAGSVVVDTYVDSIVAPLTSARVMMGMRLGTHQGPWGSLAKLQSSGYSQASVRSALAASGAEGVIWDGDEPRIDNVGAAWLECRGGTIGGGSSEIQRNIISERLLGLPREPDPDRDLPFGEVTRRQRER